jgi:hypothetical protein
MSVGISGQLYFSLQVDGVEVPMPTSKAMQVIINMNSKQALPVAKIKIPDAANVFPQQIPVNDGSVLSLRLNDDNNEAFPGYSTLRSVGTPARNPSTQHLQYGLIGILDALPYIRSNPSQNFQGSSAQAMQSIASTLNFNYKSTVSTNDVMNWLPGRNTYAKFANHLALHGWIDPSTAVAHGVDEQRNLHHIDINDTFVNSKIKARLFYGQNPTAASLSSSVPSFPVISYRSINRSGLMNNTHGYGFRLNQSDIVNGVVNKYSQIVAQTINNVLDISKDIIGQIGQRARIDLPPFDTGNTHDMYLAAKHQNVRTHAYYSQNCYVLIPNTTGLTLYDMVSFEMETSSFNDTSSTGNYIVTAITRVMMGSRYYEKLELTSAGPENENSSLIS